MRPSRIFEYLGDLDPVLEARKKTRCGQSTTGQDPVEVGEIPEDISDPVVVLTPPEGGTVQVADCEALTAGTFVVAAVLLTSGADVEIWASFVAIDPIDSVTMAVVDPNQIIATDATPNWSGSATDKAITVCRLSDTKFVILVRQITSPNYTPYAIVCTVSGTTITATAPQVLTGVNLRGSLSDLAAISPMLTEDTIILCYQDLDGFDGIYYPAAARVITFSGTSVDTIGPKLITHRNGNSIDIDQVYDLDDPDQFVILSYNVPSTVHSIVERIRRTGTTLTKEGSSANLILYTGSGNIVVSNLVDRNIGVSENILAGTRIVSSDYDTGVVLDTTYTADTGQHLLTSSEVESVGGQGGNPDRVFIPYCSDTNDGNGGRVAMEIFTITAGGIFSALKTHEIDDYKARSLRISQYGFTATKAPFVYVSNVDPNPATTLGSVVKAVVYEAGTG